MGLVAHLMGWEQRGHPSNLSAKEMEAWLAHGSLPSGSSTGVTVNQETALSSPAMLQGVRLISETVGRVPLGIYRRTDPGRELQRQHPAHRVLQNPNDEITGVELRSMVQSFAVTAGNGYAEIVFGNDGRPRELWPIPPHRVKPDRGPDGRLRYRVRTTDGDDRYVPMENMHHLPGFQRGGILGVDIVRQMQEAVGLTLATEKFAGSFFGNGSFLSGWIKFPNRMSEDAKKNIRKSLDRKHTGLDKAHRIGFLEEGMEWAQAGVPPEQAQLIETRKFSIEEVARILNVPPHLLHHLERATFNNIEELGIAFVVYSLSSWWKRWEARIEKRLLLPSERESGLIAKHNANELLRGSPEKRADFYDSLYQMGVLSANDIREMEEMNPIEGGDRYFVRRDTIPLDAVDQLVASLNTEGLRQARSALLPESRDVVPIEQGAEVREARTVDARLNLRRDFLGLFTETAETVVKRETDGVRAAIKKAFGGRDAARLRQLVDEFYETHDEWVAERFLTLLQSYGRRVADQAAGEADGDVPDDLDGFLRDYSGTLGRRWTGSSAGQMRKLIAETSPDEIEEVVNERLDEWSERRAGKEAQREVVEAGEAVVAFVYAAVGVSLKWRNTGRESCPLCQRLEGKTVGVDDYFVREGETVEPTDEETAPLTSKINVRHAPLHGGCDCVIVPG